MSSNGKPYGPGNSLSQLSDGAGLEGNYGRYALVFNALLGFIRRGRLRAAGLPPATRNAGENARPENVVRSVPPSDVYQPMQTHYQNFRNTRVAHHEKEITDPKEAQQHLVAWIKDLKTLTEAGQ